MRFISFTDHGQQRVGLRDGDEIIDLSVAAPHLPTDLLSLIEAGPDALAAAKLAVGSAGGSARRMADALTLLPLIPRPPKIICIGRNYAAHAAEGGADTPTYPEIFYRGATSLIAHGDPIVRPVCSDKLDYEGELAVVIGRPTRHAEPDTALDSVAGYALFNDATLRDYQRKSSQWTIGKNFDGTGAFGPDLVTPDEMPTGAHGVRIQTRLNGQVMQDANTEDLVFPVADLIVRLSECMTLEPGDVIVTGTPSGVGYARNPPVFMKPGDVVEIEIDGVGVLSNPIVDEQR